MGLRQESDLKASEEAAVWLHRLREQDTPEVRAAFSAWIRKGAANLEEFLFARALWKEMDHIDAGMRERLWSAGNPDGVVDFPKQAVKVRARSRRRSWLMSAAAMLAVLAAGGLLLSAFNLRSDIYVTELGEQNSVKLSDGSVMHLNTRSRAEVRLTAEERVIRLTAGEALFTVEKDAQRPFYVLTDNARIRALGTQFNVYRNSGTQTRVAVVNGVVQVSSLDENTIVERDTPAASRPAGRMSGGLRLKAGDEAKVDRDRVVKTQEPNVERAVSWRTRRLMFPGNPLAEIAAQFNRYNRTSIRIEGSDIEARRMSGVFDADDSSPLFEYLAKDPRIEVIRSADEILIRSRSSMSDGAPAAVN